MAAFFPACLSCLCFVEVVVDTRRSFKIAAAFVEGWRAAGLHLQMKRLQRVSCVEFTGEVSKLDPTMGNTLSSLNMLGNPAWVHQTHCR